MKPTTCLSVPAALIVIFVAIVPTGQAEGLQDPTPCAQGMLAADYFKAANAWREATLIAIENVLALELDADDPDPGSAWPSIPSTVETYETIKAGESRTVEQLFSAPECVADATSIRQDLNRLLDAAIAALAPHVNVLLALIEPIPGLLFDAVQQLDCAIAAALSESECTPEL